MRFLYQSILNNFRFLSSKDIFFPNLPAIKIAFSSNYYTSTLITVANLSAIKVLILL